MMVMMVTMRASMAASVLPWLLFASATALSSSTTSSTSTKNVSDCTCGFYDTQAGTVFTEAQIVYFNETDGFPDDEYVIQEYEHRRDYGWNTMYRQGAAKDNVVVGNDTTARNLTALQFFLQPSTSEHLVVGGDVRTQRQDIFYGSFQASMRPPRQWRSGSAMSMLLYHNLTESWSLDIMNTDNSSQAWISFLAKNVFPNTWLGLNFSALANETELQPWYYMEYRVDWSKEQIDYYVGDTLRHRYSKHENGSLPATPAALQYKHWSVGNSYSTQGPPTSESEADLAWTRHFFNSSLTTKEERAAFDARCTVSDACPMSDYSLRGSTAYSTEATKKWHQEHHSYRLRWVPITIDTVMAVAFAGLVAKTLVRRYRGARKGEASGHGGPADECPKKEKEKEKETEGKGKEVDSVLTGDSRPDLHRHSSWDSFGTVLQPMSGTVTPLPQYQSEMPSPSSSQRPSRKSSHYTLAAAGSSQSYFMSPEGGVGGSSTPGLRRSFSDLAPSSSASASGSNANTAPSSPILRGSTPPLPVPDYGPALNLLFPMSEPRPRAEADRADKGGGDKKAGKPAPVQRIDYLAGFIVLSAIGVTLIHFSLTFFPAVIEPGVPWHYKSEYWARLTVASFFFNQLWIGPFLMISTRFLVSNYLRTGNLANMAQKIVSRPFRLLTPVALIALLEYFLMDAGATYYLQWLASVTWSTWPYVTLVANPGVFVSQLIELAFLIPNAAPHITFTYCTGVLWTIPVQLQGAWQTLIGLVMVKQCKTPWKRFAFGMFCICNHWYALSWGSYYYAGVLLADLDLTYKYKPWLHKRPLVYYPLLTGLIVAALGSFCVDLVMQWTNVNYATYEHGWHPDQASGLSISQAGKATYPAYYIPRLNALLATVSMLAIVEICPTVQKVLSAKVLQALFPHIFTIFLIHGFVFWAVGSWAMCTLFAYGLPYWLCCLLVAIICYFTLFASLPLLTPPIEAVGKNFTVRVWEHASTEPVKRKPTSYPFGTYLVAGNNDNDDEVDELADEDSSSTYSSVLHLSGKMSQETMVDFRPDLKPDLKRMPSA